MRVACTVQRRPAYDGLTQCEAVRPWAEEPAPAQAPLANDRKKPFGGPFLDQATIDQVRSWIAAGAANN